MDWEDLSVSAEHASGIVLTYWIARYIIGSMIDEKDLEILTMLQSGERVSNSEIARGVAMTPSGVLERIRRLRQRGVLQGFYAAIDAEKVGFGLLAFVFVRTQERAGEKRVGEALAALREVLEVHHVAGEDCYLVKVRASSPRALGAILRERIGAMPEVTSTRSTVVLESHKETLQLPLATVGAAVGAAVGAGDAAENRSEVEL